MPEKIAWKVPKKGSEEEKFIFDLLRTLSSTLRVIPLYPPTHPMIKGAVIKLFLEFDNFFKKYSGNLSFDIIDNNMLICGKPAEETPNITKNLIADFKKFNIDGLIFAEGVNDMELGAFLKLLTLKPEAVAAAGGLKALMEKEQIRHISQSEVRYTRIKEEEEVVKKQDKKKKGETEGERIEGLGGREETGEPTADEKKDIVAEVSDFLSGKGEAIPQKELISMECKNNTRRLVKQLLKLIGPERAVEEVLKIIEDRFQRAGFTDDEQDFYIEKIRKETIKLKIPKVTKKQLEKELISLRKENEQLKKNVRTGDGSIEKKVEEATIELKQENVRIKREKERINSVLKNIAEGLVIVDNEGKVLLLNPAAEQLLGVNKEEKVGKHILEGLRDEHMVSLSKEKQQAIEIELAGTNNQTKKTLRASTAVIENDAGETIGMVSVLSDITKQKELDRMKDAFVSHVSHELRTPLISIQKSIELVLESVADKLDAQQKQFLEIAGNNANRLTRLVNDILDIAKLESGHMNPQYDKVKPASVLSEVFEMLNGWAQTRKIMLEATGFENLEIEADAKMLNQVFTNLIGNAIKFTPAEGKITVSVEATDTEIKCSVKDTGAGIPPESVKRIFDKFEQSKIMPQDTNTKGSGLGLAIAREIIELHGGKIWAESELGKGSSFIFVLPKEKVIWDIRD
ncbi:MAG: ATP-binding protein [Candidatus Omnitrophota bacterium]